MEVFHQKCFLLRSLLRAPLNAETAARVQNDALAVLEDSVILDRSPAEWLNEFQGFSSARNMRDSFNQLRQMAMRSGGRAVLVNGYPAEPDPKFNERLIQSKLLAISLYGRLAAFAAAHPLPAVVRAPER